MGAREPSTWELPIPEFGCLCLVWSNVYASYLPADILEETFSIVREQFGVMLTIDLKPNGRNLEVSLRTCACSCVRL